MQNAHASQLRQHCCKQQEPAPATTPQSPSLTCCQLAVVMELSDDTGCARVALDAAQAGTISRFNEVKAQLHEQGQGTQNTCTHLSVPCSLQPEWCYCRRTTHRVLLWPVRAKGAAWSWLTPHPPPPPPHYRPTTSSMLCCCEQHTCVHTHKQKPTCPLSPLRVTKSSTHCRMPG